MQIVDLRVFEVGARAHCEWGRVEIIRQSWSHFRFDASYSRIDVFGEDQEVVWCASLNLLYPNR